MICPHINFEICCNELKTTFFSYFYIKHCSFYKIGELERRLKTVRKREAESREELDRLRLSQKQDKYSMDDKCEKLQLDNAQLQDKLAEVSRFTSRWELLY